jgi:uncharacterized membrane protein YebE (DUF533 family)
MIASALKWIANAVGSGLTIVIGLLIKDSYDSWKKGRSQKADREKLTKCLSKGKEKYAAYRAATIAGALKGEEEFLRAEIHNMIPHKYWDDMLDFDREGLVKRAQKFIK